MVGKRKPGQPGETVEDSGKALAKEDERDGTQSIRATESERKGV